MATGTLERSTVHTETAPGEELSPDRVVLDGIQKALEHVDSRVTQAATVNNFNVIG